jgi:hypothetical protein
LLAAILVLNLRLLGLGFRRLPLPPLADQLWVWSKAGLFLTVGTGIPVFLSDPTRDAHSGPFRLKMALLCLAVLYQFPIFREAVRSDPQSHTKLRNAATASVSFLLWFGVGWSGRDRVLSIGAAGVTRTSRSFPCRRSGAFRVSCP